MLFPMRKKGPKLKKIRASTISLLVAMLAFASTPAIAGNATLTAGPNVSVNQKFMSYSGGFLWQASNTPSDQTIKIINTLDLTQPTVTSGDLGAQVSSIWGSGASLWVALRNGNVARVEPNGTITPTPNIVTGCVADGNGFNRIHASAEYATLSCYGSNKVLSIRVSDNSIVSSVTVTSPGAAVVRGPYTYVFQTQANQISRYLTTNLSLLPRVTSSVGLLHGSATLFTVDNNHIYVASRLNSTTDVRVTRYRFSDGNIRNVSVPGSSQLFVSYIGMASDNTNLFVSFEHITDILSFDFNDPAGPTIANATTTLTSTGGGLSYDGTYIWGGVNGRTVRFSGAAASKQLQQVLDFSVSPNSAEGQGGAFSSAITFTPSGGSGDGAITYAIDPSSTATGCALDSPTAPTTLTSTSTGTCLVYATKDGGITYESESSALKVFTFTPDLTDPLISGTESVAVTAPSTAVATYSASEAVSTWGLAGTNAGLFDISASGVVTFKTASTAGTYSIIIEATDAAGNKGTRAVTVTVAAAARAPARPSSSSAVLEVLPKKVTVANEIVTVFGAGLDAFTGATVNAQPVRILQISPNRITFRAPAGLTGTHDITLTGSGSSLLVPNGLVYGSTIREGARTVIPGFAANSTRLTKEMRKEIRTFLRANPGLNQVVCRGFTSAPATPQDRALARDRGKVTCDLIKKLRPEANVTLRSGSHTNKPGVQIRRVQITLR
jgi:hypothetical protein